MREHSGTVEDHTSYKVQLEQKDLLYIHFPNRRIHGSHLPPWFGKNISCSTIHSFFHANTKTVRENDVLTTLLANTKYIVAATVFVLI